MNKKNKMPLTLSEKREIQLAMLDEVDAFCRMHGIRYSLSSGSLLGAVRHKGFIPWDDDLDIVMPEPDFLKFYETFKSDNVLCIDCRNEKNFAFPWAILCDTHTFSEQGKALIGNGVNIDLYIIHGLPREDNDIDRYFKKMRHILFIRLYLIKVRNWICRRFPVKTIPFYTYICRKYREMSFSNSYEGTKKYIFHSDRMDWAHTYDYDLFENLIDLPFENHVYCAFSCYEKYLTQRYGDYMQLPPECERHPYHGGVYYKK